MEKNPWGTPVGAALDGQELTIQRWGTAYYYGSDGHHAVLDVVSPESVTIVVDGEAITVSSLKEAGALLRAKGVDLFSGWSSCA